MVQDRPTKRTALKTIFKQLAKRIAHFGNTNDGEALKALRSATKLLGSAKLDWHDLTSLLIEEPQSVLDLLKSMLGEKDVDLLLRLAHEKATFFCTNAGAVYAQVDNEVLPVDARGEFSDWLWDAFLGSQKKAPTLTAVKNAIHALQAVARRRGDRHEVHIRSATIDGKIYIDLANEQHQVVEIDAAGWRIVSTSPVRFWRPAGMRPLPEPRREGTIRQLRPYANLTDTGFLLFVQLLVDALHAREERPVGCLVGLEGRGKSTLAKVTQRILDPRAMNSGNPPTTVRELIVRAYSANVMVLDNLTTLSQDMSDALCRLASGVDSGMRKLFTDTAQVNVSGSRSIFFTSVRNPVSAPDLAERLVALRVPEVKDKERITRRKLWAAFEEDLPFILGALYDIAACGLRELPHVKLARLPRLAEFFEGGVACEAGHGLGSFSNAFDVAAQEALDDVVEDDAIASAIVTFMAERGGVTWKGSATALKSELEVHDRTEARVTAWKTWPKDVRAFGSGLWRLQTVLRKAGIELVKGDRTKDRHRGRSLELRAIDPAAEAEERHETEPNQSGSARVVALVRN